MSHHIWTLSRFWPLTPPGGLIATLVIDGHPNPDSLTAALARRYAEGHGEATLLTVRDLDFDPNMRFGYTRHQELEPDLRLAWEALTAADHIVLMTPVWWNSVPALLKRLHG